MIAGAVGQNAADRIIRKFKIAENLAGFFHNEGADAAQTGPKRML